jgi:hypothetical protein
MFLLIAQGRLKDALAETPAPTEITAHSIAYQVINHGLHVYFVRDAFARAVAATDLPHDFTLDDLHWPLPGMVVAWPAGFMRETVGRDICYVYAASMDAGDHSVVAMPGCPTITTEGDAPGAVLSGMSKCWLRKSSTVRAVQAR